MNVIKNGIGKVIILSGLSLFNSNIAIAETIDFIKLQTEVTCNSGYEINRNSGEVKFPIKPNESYEIIFIGQENKVLAKINGTNKSKLCAFQTVKVGKSTAIGFKAGRYGIFERGYNLKIN